MIASRRAPMPTYTPDSDHEPPSPIDKVAQRIVAYAAAGGILLAIVLWLAKVATFDARLTANEQATNRIEKKVDAQLAVTCIMARRQDPTIVPKDCP